MLEVGWETLPGWVAIIQFCWTTDNEIWPEEVVDYDGAPSMNNLDGANNEVINRIYPLPSDQLGASRDGNHWFSPWPWMFCGSCLHTANFVHQYGRAWLCQWHPSKGGKREEGACLCPGVILYCYWPWSAVDEKLCVFWLIETNVCLSEGSKTLDKKCLKATTELREKESFLSIHLAMFWGDFSICSGAWPVCQNTSFVKCL